MQPIFKPGTYDSVLKHGEEIKSESSKESQPKEWISHQNVPKMKKFATWSPQVDFQPTVQFL